MANEHVGIFLPVSEVFSDTESNFDTFISLLRNLSRTDALFWCARINLIISNPEADHLTKQQAWLNQIFTSAEISKINDFAQRHGGAKRVTVFFRGQLLELIRWIALFCDDFPEDGTTFENPEKRRSFAKALLIASDIWADRVFGENRFSLEGGITIARERALGAIRKSIEATSQTPSIFRSIGRGWALFSQYFPTHYESFNDEFRKSTHLSVEEYFICITTIAINYLNRKDVTGLFNVNELANWPSYGDIIEKYLLLESQTADDLKKALWKNVETNADNLLALNFNYLPIREKPIFYTKDGRAIILDPVFFSEKMTIGPLFLLPKEKRELAFADFGKAFEDYVCDILRRMFPDLSEVKNKRISCNIYGKDQNNQEFEIDACLNDISDVVFFETKTGLIREDKILLNNYEEYLNHLREKYVQTSTSNKGIGQLVRSIQALASRICVGENREFENAKEVYPIIVVYDSLLNSPVYGEFFASEFLRLLKPNSIVKNGYCLKGNLIVHLPIVITIDDLENLETSIEHFGFCELLSDYSRTSQDRLVSLNNFIATSHYNQHMFHNRNIANIGLEIIEKSKKAFFPNESDNSI